MRSARESFAVWITGLPASGKSTLAAIVETKLASRGFDVAVLESDTIRQALMEEGGYDPIQRERFYRYFAYAGVLLTRHGVSVIFDATANRRIYRELARQQIARFIEVYVDCPLATCMGRDPKGIYRKAREGQAAHVPGLQEAYEPPEAPEVIVHCERETPESGAERVIAKLMEKRYVDEIAQGKLKQPYES